MIVGIYGKDGSCVVLPIEKMEKAVGKTAYFLKQCMEGRSQWPGYTVVQLPANAVWRYPEGQKFQ